MRIGASALAAPLLGALSGVSAWVSLGTQAITNDANLTRIAALPPTWLLPILVLVAAVGAWAARLSLARAWPLALSALLWLPYLPGPVPAAFLIWQGTSIEASAAAWTRSWNLQAGQGAVVTLPPVDNTSSLALTLRSGAGFRPFAVDRASDDVRHLAVWVEIR